MSPSSSLEATADSIFVCDCGNRARSACAGEPFYKEFEGKRYCVLHFPGKEKSADFEKAFRRKLNDKDFDFREVWFPDELAFSNFHFTGEADFSDATFGADASFAHATFRSGASFTRATFRADADFARARFATKADFSEATFSAVVYFNDVNFSARAVANFYHVNFSAEAYFTDAIFNAEASFVRATFHAEAYFSDATFSADVDLSRASFGAVVDFSDATFNAVTYFSNATFSANASFVRASFSADAYFSDAAFEASADFDNAAFGDYVKFGGHKNKPMFGRASTLNLQSARIEKPDHVSFHTLALRPHWFVNVDARKFDFNNVDWDWRSIKEEVRSLERKRVSSPHRMLSVACRCLAVNAEESHRYEEASKFRYIAMDARRLENRYGTSFSKAMKKTSGRLRQSFGHDWGVEARTLKRTRRFIKTYRRALKIRWQHFSFKAYLRSLRSLHWLYWAASGYGERMLQAFGVLVGVWLLSALLYTQVGFMRWEPKLTSESDVATAKRDEVGTPLRLSRALIYSFAVMTFQKPEPRPATTAAQSLVILETILGPLQAALLALAIRRKFMR